MSKAKGRGDKGRKGYWKGFNDGKKAAIEEMRKPLTAEQLLKQMPKWVQMFVKENGIDPGSLVINMHTPIDDMPHFISDEPVRELLSNRISITLNGRKKS